MLSARKTWMAIVVLTLLAVWTAPAGAAPLLGIKGGGDDADKWLLDDLEGVITINVKQMMDSPIVKNNLHLVKDQIKNHEEVKALLDSTGLDPFKDVDSIIISAAGGSAKDAKMLIVVKGKFDTDKMHTALKKEAEKKESEIELVKEGQVQLYQYKKDDKVFVAGFASKSVLVATNSKEATVEAIKNGGKKSAKIGKEMKTALSKFTGKESIAMAGIVNDELKKLIEQTPRVGEAAAKLQTLTTSLTITDSVTLNVTGNASDAKAAKQLAGVLLLLKGIGQGAVQGMEELPAVLGDILEAIKIKAEKESVTIDLKITKEMIEKLSKLGGSNEQIGEK